jgi:prevent-host-death family protein
MKSIGAFAAKTHLSNLLERVSRGEKFTITRHGIPTAQLLPVSETVDQQTHQEIVEGMRALRRRVKPGKMSVREMIKEGRRY